MNATTPADGPRDRAQDDDDLSIEELVRLWAPETRLTPIDLLLRRRPKPGMITRWRSG